MKKLILFFVFILSVSLFSQSLIQTVNLPAGTFFSNGYGLVYANGNYWISSSSSTVGKGILYGVDSSGTLVDSVKVTNYPSLSASQGLAFDGTDFWYVERKTARCDLYKISPAGLVTDSIIISTINGGTSWYLGGAAWDGTGLWFSVYSPDARAGVFKVNTATKQLVDTIPALQLQPTGVTVKGDTLFYVNDGFQGFDLIYGVSRTTKDTLFTMSVPEQPGVRQNPRGLAWDGDNFWLMAEPIGAGSGRQLFKYDLRGSGSPGISVLSPSLIYGNVMIDSILTLTALIHNYGTADLILDSVKFQTTTFSTSTLFPMTIAPGFTANIPISFKPTAFTSYTDSMLIYHNDPSFIYSKVNLSGAGVYTAPYLFITPTALNFGNRRINSTSYIELEFKNGGSSNLQVDSLKLRTNNYYFEQAGTPFIVHPLSSKTIKVWFNPTSVAVFTDSIQLFSNASNGNILYAGLSGNGIVGDSTFGVTFWQGQIPDNPATSFQDYIPRSMKSIQDVNGDGKRDLAVGTENYWTLIFNGNSSVTGNVLWKYSTYFGSINTGSVDYSQGLQIASDLNGDRMEDVVIGTGGGNEFVYALNGKDGSVLWEFGSSTTTDDGDIMGLDVKRDFNGDGIPDVLAAASGNEFSGSGRFSVFLLNGLNGNVIWQINQASQFKLKYMVASTDTGGAVGSRIANTSNNEVFGFSKTGQILWNFPVNGTAWTVKEIPNIGGSTSSDIIAGTTTGNVYAIDGFTGNQIWQTSIGNVFIEDATIVPDVNENDTPDILISGIHQDLYMLEGTTGQVIWVSSTGGNILGKDLLSDLNGDGRIEVGSASLNNLAHVHDGRTGTILFTHAFGGGSSSTAAEHIVSVDDMDSNGSYEFVTCSRDGRVVMFSGGKPTVSHLDELLVDLGIPVDFKLNQNYPNPFNPSTTIRYSIPFDSPVKLSIFNMLGEEVAVLINEQVKAGYYEVDWKGENQNGSKVSSGIYVFKLEADSFVDSKKMLLLK